MLSDVFIPVKVLGSNQDNVSLNIRYIESVKECDNTRAYVISTNGTITINESKDHFLKRVEDAQIRFISKVINGVLLKVEDIKGGE